MDDEKTRLRERLAEHGERRRAALKAAELELERVVAIVPEAYAAGLSKAEIAQLAGISRPTLYAVLAELVTPPPTHTAAPR